MRVLRIAIQWLIILGCGWLLYQALTKGDNPPLLERRSWSQWEGFQAIAYGGVDRKSHPGIIDRDALRAQLAALKRAGHTTVTTGDLVDFLTRNKPLPEKALYLMFEGGRKDSFLFTQPILHDLQLLASMYTRTGDGGWVDRTFLKRRDIKRVERNAHWDVNAMGHDTARTAVSPEGAEGRFLTDLLWREDLRRFETQGEYEDRLRADFTRSGEIFSDLLGRQPLAYSVYPANTLGVSMPEEQDQLLQAMLDANYRLAFTRAGTPFNGRHAAPRALSRYVVPQDQSPEELVDLLRRSWPRSGAYAAAADPQAQAWKAQQGMVLMRDGALALVAKSRQEDGKALPAEALAWLDGAESWRDMTVSFTRDPAADNATTHLVYLKYQSPESFLRVSMANDRLLVQERRGARLENLFAAPSWNGTVPRRVQILVKGNRLHIADDAGPLLANPLPAQSFGPRGRTALGLRAPDNAHVLFRDFRAAPLPTRWIVADAPALLRPETLARATHMTLPASLFDKGLATADHVAILTAAAEGVRLYLEMDAAVLDERALDDRLAAVAAALGSLRPIAGLVVRLQDQDRDAADAAVALARARRLDAALLVHQDFLRRLVRAGESGDAPRPDWLLVDAVAAITPPPPGLHHLYPPSMLLFLEEPKPALPVWAAQGR